MEKLDKSQHLFELATRAFEKNDFKTAFVNFKEAIKAGSTPAVRFLTFMYFDDELVIKNRDEIREFLLEIANRDIDDSNREVTSNAICALATIYFNGKHVEKDIDKAMDFYNKAAELDDKSALHALGEIYRDGDEVEKDTDKAIKFFEQSNSYSEIADMYRFGDGVESDSKKAIEYYEKDNNFSDIADMYMEGDAVEKNVEEAVKWYKKAADAKDTEAMMNIGNMYLEGKKIEQDIKEAINWYQKAAEQKSKP